MSERERSREAGRAFLDSALEERLGGASPPDLTGRILTAAVMRDAEPPERSKTRRLLVAALVLLGLAVVPAIHFLQEEDDVAASPPQDPQPEELVEPETLEQFLELVKTTERVSVQVHEAFGLPMSVPGEDPPPVLTLLGPGAIQELGWSTTVPESMEKLKRDLLEGLVATARDGRVFNLQEPRRRSARTGHVVVLHLSGHHRLELELEDGEPPSKSVLFVRGLGNVVPTEQKLEKAFRTLLVFGEMTTRYRRGAYRGEELAAASARARRVARLRLHDAKPEDLEHLGLSPDLRELDLRFSPALQTPRGLTEVARFPNLRSVVMRGEGLSSEAVVALSGLEELTLLSPHDGLSVDALNEAAQLPDLRSLTLRHHHGLSLADLDGVRTAPNLRRLDLTGCSGLSTAELWVLQDAMPWCEVFSPRLQPQHLEMRIVASEDYGDDGVRFDLEGEADRLKAWLAGNGGENERKVLAEPRAIHAFNALPSEAGGPLADRNLQWLPQVLDGDDTGSHRFSRYMDNVVVLEVRDSQRVVELVPVNFHERHFTGADLVSLGRGVGRDGGPAIDYLLKAEKAAEYADWTEKHKGRHCAFVLGGEVRAAPTFIDRVPGRGQITGAFTEEEIDRLVRAVGRR